MTIAAPTLQASNIVGGSQQINDVEFLTNTDEGHSLRWTIHRDSYANQSRYVLAVWSKAELKWNDVWSLNPIQYSKIMVSPYGPCAEEKATSWQVALDELAHHANRILI